MIIRIIFWVTGAFSFINLINDMELISLYGKIKDWATAYGLFVSKVGDLLFGWINWTWFKIDKAEYHVLVLAVILSGAVGRAARITLVKRNEHVPMGSAFSIAFGIVLISLIAMAILGSPMSLWIGTAIVILSIIGAIVEDGDTPADVDPYDFLKELSIVGAIFAAILLINYMIYKPG